MVVSSFGSQSKPLWLLLSHFTDADRPSEVKPNVQGHTASDGRTRFNSCFSELNTPKGRGIPYGSAGVVKRAGCKEYRSQDARLIQKKNIRKRSGEIKRVHTEE